MGEDAMRVRESWIHAWIARSWQAPIWMGVGIIAGYLVIHCVFDALYLLSGGHSPGFEPAWRNPLWWTDFVNAGLIGYLPAAQALAQIQVARDLATLRPRLRCSDAEFAALGRFLRCRGPVARSLSLVGLAIGVAIVFLDPSMYRGSTQSPGDPGFVWALVRTGIFVWLLARLAVSDFTATRIYAQLGRNTVEVDLLDMDDLALFARRGQRSALTWVLFSSVFSLFWIGGNAAQANLSLLVLVLAMASAAFVLPLVAVRNNIVTTKQAELDRLRDQIRREREHAEVPVSAESIPSPRLANLIAYYQLIESTREWPANAANILRFILYLLLGLGSWLGGAVVERVLDSAIGSAG